MAERLSFTTPVGRLVGGSLYDPETTDYDGKPLVDKSGAPRQNFNFGVALPKTAQHWANEPWGGQIWQLAHAAFPNGETQRHDFAWKITDGDSQIPNKRGRKPCEREGYPGHWVIWFSGGFAPKVYNADGSQQIVEPNAVKPGYYVQVFGNVTDNKPSQSPGLYINHTYVALVGYGPEIQVGPDVSAAGFGQNVVLPPGASAVPVAGAFNPAPAPAVPSQPAMPPTTFTPPPAAPASAPAPLPPVAVAPMPSILAVPGQPVAPAVPAAPVAPPAPPAAPARTMTAKAMGATYEQLIANGWTDATLIQNGLMLP
jgi:hypothetical protein